MLRFQCFSYLLLLSAACAVPAAEVAVVNPAVGVAALNVEQVRDLLSGRRTAWDDGTTVVVVLARERTAEWALMRFLEVDGQQFRIGWKKLVFTGRAVAPALVDDDAALVALVARTPGAIGVVDDGRVTDGVKVVPLE